MMNSKKIAECARLLQKVIDTKAQDEAVIEEYVTKARELGTSEEAIENIVREAREFGRTSRI